LSSVLAELTGYQTSPASDIDESLLGLRTIALLATGCARHCVEAARIFGQPHDGVDKAST